MRGNLGGERSESKNGPETQRVILSRTLSVSLSVCCLGQWCPQPSCLLSLPLSTESLFLTISLVQEQACRVGQCLLHHSWVTAEYAALRLVTNKSSNYSAICLRYIFGRSLEKPDLHSIHRGERNVDRFSNLVVAYKCVYELISFDSNNHHLPWCCDALWRPWFTDLEHSRRVSRMRMAQHRSTGGDDLYHSPAWLTFLKPLCQISDPTADR